MLECYIFSIVLCVVQKHIFSMKKMFISITASEMWIYRLSYLYVYIYRGWIESEMKKSDTLINVFIE